MSCDCSEIKEQIEMMRHSIGGMYAFLIEIRDLILSNHSYDSQRLHDLSWSLEKHVFKEMECSVKFEEN